MPVRHVGVADAPGGAIFRAMNQADTPAVDPWLERFLRAYYDRRPVNATFVGVHEHDHRFADLSAAGVDDTVSQMRSLLEEADTGRKAPDAPLAGIDRRLAEGFLRIQGWEYSSGHFLGNPSIHVGEAVFGLMALLLPESTPSEDRLHALRARMAAVPDFLAQSRLHLHEVPTPWTLRAIRECKGGLAFLRGGVSHVDSRLQTVAEPAAAALEDFGAFLESTVLRRPKAEAGCGPEAFGLYLREGHFLTQSADEIVRYARDEMAKADSELSSGAAEFGAENAADAIATLADRRPDVTRYYRRYQEIWDAMRKLSDDRALLTWPDFPIRYVPRPQWARASAPDLYFLFYRSPAAFGRPAIHDYLVTPIDDSMSAEERETLLRADNDGVIKLNHVVHHGGIGHHVQNWHAFRSPLRIGRIAAVDCASRIAMFCGATMAEGWACYATDLMAEVGGLTPLERFALRHARVRMCARAIVDVELHNGRMTLDDAAAFYQERAGMTAAGAEAEAVKNSMFPASALIYLMGTDMIHELRADLCRAPEDDLTLGSFHDAFLSYGSIPVRLIGNEMRRRAALGLPLGAHEASS